MMKNSAIITVVVVAVIVGAASFYGGMKYQQSKAQSGFGNGASRNGQFSQRQGGGGPGGANAGGSVRGEITSTDDKSITVKLQDGSSKIVLISGSTSINEAAQATKQDLTTGKMVAVFGSSNSDGSVTAQNIQLNPMMFRGGRPNGAPSGNPSEPQASANP